MSCVMDSILLYKTFNYNKSYEEVAYNSTNWIFDFNFYGIELLFLKSLIKFNSFKSNIPNLFERLQLLLNKIEDYKLDCENLNNKIVQYNNEMVEILKNDKSSCDEAYLITYYNLAEEVFEFVQKYKNFKSRFYEFLIEIINNK